MTKEQMRELIWKKTMSVTIEMQYKKSQFLKGKYAAYKEIWDELGGDIVVNGGTPDGKGR